MRTRTSHNKIIFVFYLINVRSVIDEILYTGRYVPQS